MHMHCEHILVGHLVIHQLLYVLLTQLQHMYTLIVYKLQTLIMFCLIQVWRLLP